MQLAIKWPEMLVKWPFQKVVSFLTEQTLGRSKHMANFEGKKLRFVDSWKHVMNLLQDWKCWNGYNNHAPNQIESQPKEPIWKLFACGCQIWSIWDLQNHFQAFERKEVWLASTQGMHIEIFFKWYRLDCQK